MRTTVLVPLHRSAPWLESLTEQLGALRGTALVIVSDATGADDTLAALRARHGDDPAITWLSPRSLAPGWVSHCNDMLARASTEFVMWLPHDDHIDADWITEAERRLDEQPAAIAACGRIHALQNDSHGRGGAVQLPPFVADPDAHGRLVAAVETLLSGVTADLGVLFRSVTRRALVPPLPAGLEGDDWSDVLWALHLLRLGTVVELSASYGKRWHDASTHFAWGDHTADAAQLRLAVARALTDEPGEARADVLARVWGDDAARSSAALQREREHSAQSLAELRAAIENSRSWRSTAWLRALRDLLPGARRR